MKLLFVYDNSIGIHYLKQALSCVPPEKAEIKIIKLSEYPAFDDSQFDGLIYNTFPDESHRHKFRKDLIAVTDEKFISFASKKKFLLLDSHDDGNNDAFCRFGYPKYPRIKLAPGTKMQSLLNIAIEVPFAVNVQFMNTTKQKSVPLVYCAKLDGYETDIRKKVFDAIAPFNPFISRLDLYAYADVLTKAKIVVVAPGWGEVCLAHYEALAAGAMLFAHESVRNYKLFPFADLIEDKHYVLYNLENITEKLTDLMANSFKVARISKAGSKAFYKGYNLSKTAEQIIDFFSER